MQAISNFFLALALALISNSSITYASQHVGTSVGTAPTASIDSGVVIGTTTSIASVGVDKYLGIPFAKSPPERFSPPQQPESWNSPLNATAFGPACIQQFPYPKKSQEFQKMLFWNPPLPQSEDCMYLNVYTPAGPAPSDGRAVMFWIYGGGLSTGAASYIFYDGSYFAAEEDVVVVTANYRLNVFGFPNSHELPLTGQNLGFLDQRFALDWVQRNIAAFGGSPEKVTIFGESSGAFSVDALLTSYSADSKPPFRGAIAESGQASYVPAQPETYSSWTTLAGLLNCPGKYDSNLTCIRAAPATSIRALIDKNELPFNPVYDNVTLVSDPVQRRESGNIAHVPIFGGTNAQEGRVFVVGQNDTKAFLTSYLGNDTKSIKAIEAAFPLGQDGIDTPYDQIAQIYTEAFFQCGQAQWANSTAKLGIPAWRYYYNASFANEQLYPGLGAYHGSEIPMVWGTYPQQNLTTQQYALSSAMRSAWARFARNPSLGPGWNRVGSGAVGEILNGATQTTLGGLYTDDDENARLGAFDLAVWGDVNDVKGSGVTVIDSAQVDYRCPLLERLFMLP